MIGWINITTLKVSIIISNYQGRRFLYKCLNHLKKQTYSNFEVIIVDAGSTDGSVDFIRKNYPEIVVIEVGKRIGIGEAINIGIKRSSGQIISFDFNTDEYVFPNWLEELVIYLKKYKFNIIAGTTRLIYKTNLIDEAGVNINFFGIAKKVGYKENVNSFNFIEKPVTYVGSPIFHKKILKKVGRVDENYEIYSEDLDFCYRAKLQGFQTYSVPSARSYHQIRGTTGKNISNYEYFFKRARIRFLIIYCHPIRLIIALLYTGLLSPLSTLLHSLIFPKKFKVFFKKFLAEFRAIKWNIWHIRSTFGRRQVFIINQYHR